MVRTDLPEKGRFEGNVYAFSTKNQSFQHVDKLDIVDFNPPVQAEVVAFDDERLLLRTGEPLNEPVQELEVEWINDYILRRTLDQLEYLIQSENQKKLGRLEEIFYSEPEGTTGSIGAVLRDDGLRNQAQKEAIQKSLQNRVTFIWGPPGTGKTATLGFIMANYLLQDKKVLFASNTNRAVDVGLLSTLSALQDVGAGVDSEQITRFGDIALEHDAVSNLHFDTQIEKKRAELMQQVHQPDRDDKRRQFLLESINKMIDAGKKIPSKLEYELELLGSDVDDDEESLDEEILDEIEMLPFREIRRKKLVATTLARVCTSELLQSLSFDAVVIDEASMANIPYLLVLAARSREHIVFAGDPMQLPPISMTTDREYREFLEKDVYTLMSGALEMEDLFMWKDDNPGITCFFDTQYRLNDDLAGIISEIFYDGRLKTGKLTSPQMNESPVTVHVVDTAKYNPSIQTGTQEGGFRPVNEIHRSLVKELVRRLMLREHVLAHEIGIIVPFRSVVWDYRKALREDGIHDVEVGTIHTFQGREKEAIIFDTVMSGAGSGRWKRHFSVRPFDEKKNGLSVPRLLNVAFSRARERMVILADMEHIDKVYNGMFLGNLLERIKNGHEQT